MNRALSPEDLVASLRWRYAVKKFAPATLPQATIEALKQSANLTPTSLGLQPVRLIHVRRPSLRQALIPFSQPKVASASDLFVIAAETRLSEASAAHYMRRIADVRGSSRESLGEFEAMVRGVIAGKSHGERIAWAHRQAYLVLGNLLSACALLGVDACPMEGFSAPDVDRVLSLGARGLTTSVMLALGKRAADDAFAAMTKVRRPLDEFVVTL